MSLRSGKLFAVILVSTVVAFAADPLVGTWKLNIAKSHFNPGPPPQSQVRIYESLPGGMRVMLKTTNPSGQSTTIEIPQNLDGKDYPIMGPGPASEIAMTKVDNQIAEAILKHGEIIVGTSRRILSADGKTLTVTYKGTDPEGVKVDNVAVYEKQ
jgi:hypothetical protein